MVKANLKDGRTMTFDLRTFTGAAEWHAAQSDSKFQESVSGIGIYWEGELFAFPLPRAFRTLRFSAELLRDKQKSIVGERISCQADDILGTVTVYFGAVPRLARYDLRRIGRPRYQPRPAPLSPVTPED